jgi:spore coat polysaccharide biosynthesis protein SpsF
MKRRVVVSIEARMTSTRLPGKVLKQCMGKSMMELMVERVRRSETIDDIIIATTTNATDDPLELLAHKLNVSIHRGSENDVVQRVVDAHRNAGSEIVVQLTGDCPLIDPEVIDVLVRFYRMNKFDYVSNAVVRSYPIGLDTQVSSFQILEQSLQLAVSECDHEHLYATIYKRPEQFNLYHFVAPHELIWPELRLTLDTQEDFNLICSVFEALYPKNNAFRTIDIIRYLKNNPQVVELNQYIPSKGLNA